VFHKGNLAMAILTPLAFIVPSSICLPIDVTLGILFPFHSHVAMNYVITDYVPKSSRTLARAVLLATTLIAAAGLLKLNLKGPGLTATVKSLWKKPETTSTSTATNTTDKKGKH
jgi:succinate dehydrogenase (ubiquinone) membrane anchor subunit